MAGSGTRKIILNVLIGGVSVGMTFSAKEAHDWLSKSHSNLKKEIRPVPHLGYPEGK